MKIYYFSQHHRDKIKFERKNKTVYSQTLRFPEHVNCFKFKKKDIVIFEGSYEYAEIIERRCNMWECKFIHL